MDKVAELLPTKIEDAVNGTPISMLAKVVDSRNIEAFLAIELTKLQSLINVDARLNLQPHQIPVIADHLIKTFRNENLADFVICFKNGAMGKYDDKLLRLDGAIITQWMYKYLDEKYQVIETNLMKEKENPYAPIEPRKGEDLEAINKWFEKLYAAIGYKEKASNNVKENEYERFKLGYQQPSENALLKRELHKQYIAENYNAITGKPNENFKEEKQWTEEQGYFEIEGTLIKAGNLEEAREKF